MSNLHQPPISKIIVTHLLFGKPWRRVRGIRNRNKAIVVGVIHIIDPRVRFRDLMERIIGAWRKLRIVSVNLPDAENPGGRTAVLFGFSQTFLTLSYQTAAPCETIFTEKGGNRGRDRRPISFPFPLESLQMPTS